MKNTVTIEKLAETRAYYTFDAKNKNGESVTVEITKVFRDKNDKHDIVNLWKKHGFIKNLIDSHLSVKTYVTDADGLCWGKYNPFVKLAEGGKRQVIDFDNLLEATDENITKALEMVETLAFA